MFLINSIFLSVSRKDKPLPWEQIKEKLMYDVNITTFESSDEFFVELPNIEIKEQLNRRLRKVKLKPLENIEAGDYCIVESLGKIHRAMVYFSSPMSSMCYSVDTAELFYFNEEKPPIYKMSSKIRKIIPFQAIRCSFYGLKIPNNSQWISYIKYRVLSKIQKPQIFVVKSIETSENNTNPMKAMDEHQVILYDGADERNINNLLAEMNLAELDMTAINQQSETFPLCNWNAISQL